MTGWASITRVSKAYTGKTLRAIYSGFHDLWDKSGFDPLPFPILIMIASALLASFIQAQKADCVTGPAGQILGIIHQVKPAAQILEEKVEEAADILTRRLPETVTVAESEFFRPKIGSLRTRRGKRL